MALLRRKTGELDLPLDDAEAPEWEVPERFNFTRDVVEAQASDLLRPALTFVDREGIVDRRTFREVAGDAARWAHLLRTRLDRGDRVVLALGNVPSWHLAMLGALKSGVVAVPCSDTLRARDLAFRVRHSGARLVVAERALEVEIEEMSLQLGSSVPVLYLDEALEELRRYMPVAPSEDTTSAETALILYTSGTAQEPRGAVHTHGYTWTQRLQATHWLDAHEGDVVWCTADSGSSKAIWNSLLGPWSHGAEIVIHEGPFEAEERLSLLQRLGVTVLCQTPTEYRMLAKLEKLEFAHLPRLRHAVSTGEPLNPEVIARFQDALGLTIYDGYGQTENSLLVASTPASPLRPGSMGQPTPWHDVAVIDGHGNVCPPGVEGDLALLGRPPTLFSGYWEAPTDTDTLFRDGWFVTGDRATRDDDGYFWFVGRTDDVIVSAGCRVGPFEVESALLEHPAVAESAVVGVPDADRGQIVMAFVVLRPGHEPGDRLVSELQEHVKAVTAPYKYPREIAFVDALPKNQGGKIQRVELRRLHAELTAAPALSIVPDPEDAPDPAVTAEEERARREAEEAARRDAIERTRIAAAEAAARATTPPRTYPETTHAGNGAAASLAESATDVVAAVERARTEAEERARIQAEEQARARAAAREAARIAAEAEAAAREAARLAAEAEAAEQARVQAEQQARAEAEAREAAERAEAEAREAARLAAEAEAAEQARVQAEQQARAEAEAREAAERAEAEAREAARLAAEAEAREAARLAAEAEAAEQARVQAEQQARAEAEEREAAERAEAEAREAARLAAEAEAREAARSAGAPVPLDDVEIGEASVDGEKESRADARRRRREEKEAEKRRDAEERRMAKEAEAQRKREEAAAREDAKRREAEEKEAAKRREAEEKEAAKRAAEDAKRREAEEKEAAKRQAEEARLQAKLEAEQRKRDEVAAREAEKAAAKRREEDERRRQADERKAAKARENEERRRRREEQKASGRGRLFKREEPDEYEDVDDGTPVEPIPDIVERLRFYSRDTAPVVPGSGRADEPVAAGEPSASQVADAD